MRCTVKPSIIWGASLSFTNMHLEVNKKLFILSEACHQRTAAWLQTITPSWQGKTTSKTSCDVDLERENTCTVCLKKNYGMSLYGTRHQSQIFRGRERRITWSVIVNHGAIHWIIWVMHCCLDIVRVWQELKVLFINSSKVPDTYHHFPVLHLEPTMKT